MRNAEEAIAEDNCLQSDYTQMKFAEKVIHGEAALVAGDASEMQQKAKAKAALKVKKLETDDRHRNRAELKQFLARKGK